MTALPLSLDDAEVIDAEVAHNEGRCFTNCPMCPPSDTCSGCGYCGTDDAKQAHCPTCCPLGYPF